MISNRDQYNHCVNLSSAARACPDGRFQCASGHCVSNASRCDGYGQCTDVSDEAGCPPRYPNGQYCPADRFTCNNTLCIRRNWICDGGKIFENLNRPIKRFAFLQSNSDNDCRDNR